MLKLDDIYIRRGALRVLEGASLSIGPTEKAGLAGVNGSGKTTLLQIAAGRLEPDAGSVTRPKKLAYLPQEPKLDRRFGDDATVRDVAASGSPLAGLARELAAAEKALVDVDSANLDRVVEEYGALEERYRHEGGYKIEADAGVMLNGLGLDYVELDRRVGDLSAGERTRLEMGEGSDVQRQPAAPRRANQPPRRERGRLADGLPGPAKRGGAARVPRHAAARQGDLAGI